MLLNVGLPLKVLLNVALSPLAELVNANTRYVAFARSVKLGVVTVFDVPLALAASDAGDAVGVGGGVGVGDAVALGVGVGAVPGITKNTQAWPASPLTRPCCGWQDRRSA